MEGVECVCYTHQFLTLEHGSKQTTVLLSVSVALITAASPADRRESCVVFALCFAQSSGCFILRVCVCVFQARSSSHFEPLGDNTWQTLTALLALFANKMKMQEN